MLHLFQFAVNEDYIPLDKDGGCLLVMDDWVYFSFLYK